jgi:hypothetical protein
MRKLRGPDHPDVATAMGNLADVLVHLDERREAEELYLEALRIRTARFGPSHRLTVRSLRDLERFYHSAGDLAAAEAFRTRAEAAESGEAAM